MSCEDSTTVLDASGTGSITKADASGAGGIVRQECCPAPVVQQQQLAKLWRRQNKGNISTVPMPFGTKSIGWSSLFGLAGPPAPGGKMLYAVLTQGPPTPPPPAPDSTPVNNNSES